jgi:transposase
MEHSTVYLGIDYHDRFLQVCLMDRTGKRLVHRRCDNAVTALAALPPAGVRVHASLEACNGAADLAGELVDVLGWSVHLAHPSYVHRLKQSPDKTDWSDAQLLADLLRVGYLPRAWLPPQPIRELRRLVRHRQALVDQRRAVKLRIDALLRDHRVQRCRLSRWTRLWRQWTLNHPKLGPTSAWLMQQHWQHHDQLTEQIKAAEQRLRQQTADDPVVQQLQQTKGIGLVIASVLRAEVGRFDRFGNGKQLSRFCGLSPANASSGNRQADAGLITAANRPLRSVLIEAAWLLIRHNRRWRKLSQQLLRRGKPPCVMIAAVANRWIRSLYHSMQPQPLCA